MLRLSSLHGPAELFNPALLSLSDHVLNSHLDGRLGASHLHCLHYDQLAEPLLEVALDQKLDRSRHFFTVRLEHDLGQAGAESRPHDTLAWYGEEHLLDHVPNVSIGVRRRSAAPPVDLVRKVNSHSRLTAARPAALCSAHAHLSSRHDRRALRGLRRALARAAAALQAHELAHDLDPHCRD